MGRPLKESVSQQMALSLDQNLKKFETLNGPSTRVFTKAKVDNNKIAGVPSISPDLAQFFS